MRATRSEQTLRRLYAWLLDGAARQACPLPAPPLRRSSIGYGSY